MGVGDIYRGDEVKNREIKMTESIKFNITKSTFDETGLG